MKAKYRERRTYEKFDNEHYAVFLNEKETMVPVTTGMGNEDQEVEQVPGYEYEGSQQDGSTLIVAEHADRDSLINGIIRILSDQRGCREDSSPAAHRWRNHRRRQEG